VETDRIFSVERPVQLRLSLRGYKQHLLRKHSGRVIGSITAMDIGISGYYLECLGLCRLHYESEGVGLGRGLLTALNYFNFVQKNE